MHGTTGKERRMKRISRALMVCLLAGILSVRTGADQALCRGGISSNPFKIMAEDQRINDDAGVANQFGPAIAVHKYGLSVAAWIDYRNGGTDVYFQLYSRRGKPFGTLGNVKVNDAAHADSYFKCDVAMDGYGNFLVVWEGGTSGVSHIYGQWYLANGRPSGGNFQIDGTAAAVINNGASVTGLDPGGAVVVWTDRRANPNGSLMLQRFGRGGVKLGSNIEVDASSTEAQVFGSAGADNQGRITVAWQEGMTGSKILARRFLHGDLNPLNSFQVAPQSDPAAISCYSPSLGVASNGDFAVFWMADYGAGQVYRQARLYKGSGNPATDVFRVDEPGKFDYQGEVRVVNIPDPLWGFVWSGNEGGDWNIYYRRCNSEGFLFAPSEPVNELPGRQMAPDVASDRRGNLLFVWNDNRNADFDIYGSRIGSDIPYSITAGAGFDGLVPVSWEPPFGDTDHKRYIIYRGESLAEEPQVLATVDAGERPLPDMMLDFIDTTAENGRTYYYAVRVDGADTQANISDPVSPYSGGHILASSWSKTNPVIDGNFSSGEWEGASVTDISEPSHVANVHLYMMNNNRWLYLAVVDSCDMLVEPATALGMLFDMNHDLSWPKTGPSNEGLVALGPAGAGFMGYWGSYPEHLGGDALKTMSSMEHAISGGSGVTVYEASLDMSANPYPVSGGMTIGFSIWVTDPGNFYGLHYGNAGEWPWGALWEAAESLGSLKLAEETGLEARSGGAPESFTLGRNYPNPFNPSTVISFRVGEACRVTLKVYGASGREIAVPVDRTVAAGNHSVRFDASGLPAGIYVYRLQAGGFSSSRKMAVVK